MSKDMMGARSGAEYNPLTGLASVADGHSAQLRGDWVLQVAEDVELERAAQHRHWAQCLERGRYETARARLRHEGVDPGMRLVARTLERDSEAALAAEQALEAEHTRELARQPVHLQAAVELDAIRGLAEDVPARWRAPTARDRQAIARLVPARTRNPT